MTYRPPKHYTQEELRQAALDDLRVDLRCAIRDGLAEYAERVRAEIARMQGDVRAAEGR